MARADGDNFFFCMKENDPEVIRERLNQVTETLNDRFKISTSAQEAPFHLMIHQGVYLVDDPGLEITVIQDRTKTACRSRAAQVDNLCVFYDAEFTRKLKREHELNDQFESSCKTGSFRFIFSQGLGGQRGSRRRGGVDPVEASPAGADIARGFYSSI